LRRGDTGTRRRGEKPSLNIDGTYH
jgi:hypothetical protein